MSTLQRIALEGGNDRICENCGAEFRSLKARYCSKVCRTAVDKGGKTYEEKRLAVISRVNERWLNNSSDKRKSFDPTQSHLTNY